MLASNTKSLWRYASGNTGLKCSNTLSAIERVSRVFRSHEYSPDQRKVLPFTRWTPSMSILRNFQNSNSDSGKSLPTTPTRRTGVKKLALSAAYEAEPPSKSACSSTGVLTVSSAMEPTTRRDIEVRGQRPEEGKWRSRVNMEPSNPFNVALYAAKHQRFEPDWR